MDARAEAEATRTVEAAPAGGGPLRRRLARSAEPLARAQRAFNDAILKVTDALSVRIDEAAARAEAAERRARELEERLLRLERRSTDAPPATVAAQPRQDALPDYFAYEARMRAPVDEVRERQRPYLERLRGHEPVLDVGCGRGELLQLLRDAGIEARGVDANADMVAYARGEGLDVTQADLFETLERERELGAVAALRPGGVLVAETINPATPAALRHFFADLTHAQPIVPETLELLARQAGFADTEIVFLNPQAPSGDPRLDAQLYAPLDYALVAVA